MKNLRVTQKEFQQMRQLYKDFYEIYGDEEKTVWRLDDLDEMRKIGQEFMEIFAANLTK